MSWCAAADWSGGHSGARRRDAGSARHRGRSAGLGVPAPTDLPARRVPGPDSGSGARRGSAVVVHTEDGLDLTAWHAPATGPATGTSVLVLPGNAGSRAARVPLARALSAAGFDVLLLDYRGYGGNPGSPTEQGLAADARRPTTISWRTAACLPPGWCCSGRAWARRSPPCGCQKV